MTVYLDNDVYGLLRKASHSVFTIKLDIANQIYEVTNAIKHNVRPEHLDPIYKDCDLNVVLAKLQNIEQNFITIHDLLYHLEQNEISCKELDNSE